MPEVDLGFCPRCKSEWPMMTRVVDSVKFCHLCSYDVEENKMERRRWVKWAKDYAKNMASASDDDGSEFR